MARRLLDVATAAGKEEARSDFKENTEEEDTVESEDFKEMNHRLKAFMMFHLLSIAKVQLQKMNRLRVVR